MISYGGRRTSMAVFEEIAEGLGGSLGMLGTGVALLVLAPTLLPIVGRALKPVTVAMLQSGIVGYRRLGETTRELLAEARAELEADARR
jgi:hypothetical protein